MKKMSKFCGVLLTLALPSLVLAQGQVKKKVIDASYSRSSINHIVITYGDQWDNAVINGVDAIYTGSKFDINEIDTKVIRLDGAFRTAAEQQAASTEQSAGLKGAFSGIAAKPDTLTQRLLTEYINNNNIGKQVYDYMLDVDTRGMFNFDLLNARCVFNAVDNDIKHSDGVEVHSFNDQDKAMLANCYIIVFDAKEPHIGETTKKDGTKVPLYMANVSAYVFAVDSAEDVIGNIWGNMWITKNDDEATCASKRELYRNLRIPMKCVAAVSNSASSEDGMADAITGSYSGLLRKAENKIAAWEVASTTEEVHPYITAKIGTKEGLKNAQRFKIFENTGEEPNQYTVKKGYARATVINDNDTIATGETGVSYFYQISGGRVHDGAFLKQSNDIKLGVSLDYNFNGFQKIDVFGSFSMVDLSFDYLAYMHKNGISHYGRINLGFDYANKKPYVNAAVGYMCGLKVKQLVEFQPMINVGVDMVLKMDGLTKEAKKTNYGVFIDPGLRIAFNCGYPFQLFIQADYAYMLMEGDTYKYLNDGDHKMGLGLGAGMKWTF